RQFGGAQLLRRRRRFDARLLEHAAYARVRILHVVDRILLAARARQVDVEGELRIGLAHEKEETHRIAADLVDQIAHRDVVAGTLADLHLLAALHYRDHLVQHVIGITLRNADLERLQSGPDAHDRAVVIGALFVDDTTEAAFPL